MKAFPHRRRLCLGVLAAVFLVADFAFAVFVIPEDAIDWRVLDTTYLTIRYQNEDDLKIFHKNVDFGTGGFFGGGKVRGDTLTERVASKMDALFLRVQEILDMQKRVEKPRINLYSDKEQLGEAFFNIYKLPCRIRAWYIYDNNTIYINVRDVHAGLVAHEVAHAVIDHFLEVRPPRASAEILARYVDSHLDE